VGIAHQNSTVSIAHHNSTVGNAHPAWPQSTDHGNIASSTKATGFYLTTRNYGCGHMPKDIVRVITRGTDGELRIKEYNQPESLLKMHTQVGIDDCSTDLGLRGLPVFRGLIGPMPEGKNIVRYESPEVFETLTKEWSTAKTARRRGAAPPQTQQLLVELSDDSL